MKTETPTVVQFRVDAWLPPEMAERAENVGVKKASMSSAPPQSRAAVLLSYTAGGTVHGFLRRRYERQTSPWQLASTPKVASWGSMALAERATGFCEARTVRSIRWASRTRLGPCAWGINSRGDIVGGYQSADSNMHGFIRDEDGQFRSIGFPVYDLMVSTGQEARQTT